MRSNAQANQVTTGLEALVVNNLCDATGSAPDGLRLQPSGLHTGDNEGISHTSRGHISPPSLG